MWQTRPSPGRRGVGGPHDEPRGHVGRGKMRPVKRLGGGCRREVGRAGGGAPGSPPGSLSLRLASHEHPGAPSPPQNQGASLCGEEGGRGNLNEVPNAVLGGPAEAGAEVTPATVSG